MTVSAATPESARALHTALSEFRTKLVELDAESYQVEIALLGDAEIVAVLGALEEYVTTRRDGPARIGLEGRTYTLHPDSQVSELPEPFP